MPENNLSRILMGAVKLGACPKCQQYVLGEDQLTLLDGKCGKCDSDLIPWGDLPAFVQYAIRRDGNKEQVDVPDALSKIGRKVA